MNTKEQNYAQQNYYQTSNGYSQSQAYQSNQSILTNGVSNPLNQPGMNHSTMNQMNQVGMSHSIMNQMNHSTIQPGINQAILNQPGMNQAPLNQPGMNHSTMNQPGMNHSTMNQPGMNHSTMNQPGMHQAPLNQPLISQPGMNQAPLNQPGMNHSTMNQPGMHQAPLNQLVINQSGMNHSTVNQYNTNQNAQIPLNQFNSLVPVVNQQVSNQQQQMTQSFQQSIQYNRAIYAQNGQNQSMQSQQYQRSLYQQNSTQPQLNGGFQQNQQMFQKYESRQEKHLMYQQPHQSLVQPIVQLHQQPFDPNHQEYQQKVPNHQEYQNLPSHQEYLQEPIKQQTYQNNEQKSPILSLLSSNQGRFLIQQTFFGSKIMYYYPNNPNGIEGPNLVQVEGIWSRKQLKRNEDDQNEEMILSLRVLNTSDSFTIQEFQFEIGNNPLGLKLIGNMFPAILPGQSFTNTYLIACDNKIPSLNVPYQMTFILSGSPSRDFKQAYSSFEFCHGMKAIGKDTTDVPIHLFFQHHLKGNRAGIGQNASAWVSQDKFLDDWKNNSKHTSSFSLETNAIERWFDQFGIKDHSISGYIKVIEQKLGINRVYIVASRNVQGDIVIYASLKIDLSNGLPCLLELRFTGDSFRQSQITLKHSMDYEEIPYAVCKSIQGILLS